MSTKTLIKDNELKILNGYFPDQESFINCIDDIHSIEENYGRTDHLDENTPFKNCDGYWFKELKRKKQNSNKFDFEEACSKVQILREFAEGEQLNQIKLLGLASNLYWISGGFKWMKEIMQRHNNDGNTDYSNTNFNTLKYLRKKNRRLKGGYFEPMPLAQYSPHTNDHRYDTIACSVRKPQGYVRQLEKPDLMSLSEAEEKFKEEFEAFSKDKSNSIYLFKCPAGFGKTRHLLEAKGVTIALPTHALKDEVSDKMKADHVCSPETPSLENSTRNEEIEFYHNAGLSNEKFRLLVWLRHHANSKQDRDKASRFICQHNRTYNTEKTVLTTHPRGVCNEYDHNTLIFDEDPISHVLSIKSTTLNQLNKLLLLDVEENYLNFFDELYSQCSWMDEKSIKKIPDCKLELSDIEEELIESKVSFDVVGFINADYVYKNEGELHYISRKELPQDKKIAIMSATCSPMIYKKLYGERVKVVDLSNIEITGNIIQHTKKSYSKTSLEGSIEEANDKLTGDAAITFKGKKEDISKADDLMHFGNLRGHDYLKGFNLDVIGTPHKTNALYLLRAKAIGIDFDETEVNFEYNLVRYNGFEFKFNSFNHPELTQLQLQCIEADLIQAVGRARLLREDSTVNVYSNLPLNQAEFRYN